MNAAHINASFYLTASSKQKGALGIFHAYGAEEALARAIGVRVGGKTTAVPMPALAPHDLRYGWLRTETGEVIDEVMLAAPAAGQRVLMTHGGRVIREQVEAYLEQSGFSPISIDSKEIAQLSDTVLDTLLASCVTEGQAAAVLAAREQAGGNAELPLSAFAHIFTQHRVVLAGAPNAGKSSLLNALAGYDRAFVDAEAGATRDVVDELVDLAGYPVWVGDMPGYAAVQTDLDAEAWTKAARRLRLAEEIWFVVDASEEWSAAADSAAKAVAEILQREGEPAGEKPVLIILNKTDRPRRLITRPWENHFPAAPVVSISTLPDGNALDALEEYVAENWGIG